MTGRTNTTDLVRLARRGDTDAFGELVRRFQDMALAFAYDRLGDRHLAEDAAQEAFLTAFESLSQLRDDAAFPGWLRAAVRTRCERIRRGRREAVSLDRVWSVPALEASPAELVEERELREAVRGEISALPEEERLAITLAYVGRCSHRQIADFLDLPPATVNNQLRSARTRLAARLRNPTRRLLAEQAPSRTSDFIRKVQEMIHPVEMQQPQPRELPGGYTTTTSDVWRMLSACREGDLATVRDLVEQCPGLVQCEYNDTRPIHFAVREGHLPLVRYLLDCGADPAYRTYRFGDSLLQMAREREYDDIAGLLEESLSQRFPLSEESQALLHAAAAGDVGQIEALLAGNESLVRTSDETGSTALHMACAGGHFGAVRLLLERDADAEAVDSRGFRPVHSALFRNTQGWISRPEDSAHEIGSRLSIAGFLLGRGVHYNIFLAAVLGDLSSVRGFLEEDPGLANFEESHRRRPLSAAAWRGDLAMVRLLLEHGADPSLPESDCPRGHSLWIAAFRGDVEMARLLLEHGADPESNAESGGRAIDQAREHPAIFELLVAHGAQPGESPKDRLFRAISGSGRDLNAAEHPDLARDQTMFWGEGILVMAARNADIDMLEMLIRHGATVPDVSKWGRSYYFRDYEVADYLLQNGMNPNHMNWQRTTLLHDMAWDGDLDKARLLLDRGADLNPIDDEYRSTPLGLAARAGRADMVRLLLDRGADPEAAGEPWAAPLAWARKGGHDEIAQRLVEATSD